MKRMTWVSEITLSAALLAFLAGACGSEALAPPLEINGSGGSANGAGGDQSNASSGDDSSSGTGAAEGMCPHEGAPVLDPSTLTACPETVCAGGGHCIPTSVIVSNSSQEEADQLADCDAENKCVPDVLIESGGDFILPTCHSIAGAEGRCTSICIPQVAEQKDSLPQDVCTELERCVPCYNPLDGVETGACALSCDPGPTEPPVVLPTCCDGDGTCVPKASVPPEQADSLPADSCPQDNGELVCAPTAYIENPDYVATPCETDSIIGGGEPGACILECLITGFGSFAVGQSTCPDKYKCAPCQDPLSGDDTGACG